MGYHHAVEAAMSRVGLGWMDVPEDSFPEMVDTQTLARSKPLMSWPQSGFRWAAFVERHRRSILNLDDSRVALKQILSLAKPPRAHGVDARNRSLAGLFVDPTATGLRLAQDGHKGTSQRPSALAHLIAACGADTLVTPRLRQMLAQEVVVRNVCMTKEGGQTWRPTPLQSDSLPRK
jgi:hypothetical protein